MTELRRDGRALLDEARQERTPDADTRERVYQALLASPAFLAGAPAPPAGKRPLSATQKWLLLAALAAAVIGALYLAGHAGEKPRAAKSKQVPARAAALESASPLHGRDGSAGN
jgi:hypothetical protein